MNLDIKKINKKRKQLPKNFMKISQLTEMIYVLLMLKCNIFKLVNLNKL